MLVDFSSGYLRTQENFMASVGEARAATFPEDLQRLIGWAPSNSGLGLENLRRRLNLQYANCHELISEQRGNHWYTRLQMELAPC